MSYLLSLLCPSHIQVRLSTVYLGMFKYDFVSVLFPVHVEGVFFFCFCFVKFHCSFLFTTLVLFNQTRCMHILFKLTLTIHITITFSIKKGMHEKKDACIKYLA